MNHKQDLAIISMACRFPDADNTEEFWHNISTGKSSITDIPKDRWDCEEYFSKENIVGKCVTKKGNFLDDIKSFDAKLFNIKESDAQVIDPQQRLLLELTYETLKSTGNDIEFFEKKNIGVYIGVTKSDYKDIVQNSLINQETKQNSVVIGVLENLIAARISNTFNLNGPSLTIDTACSSSLVALHSAKEAIYSGSCEMALVGGVNLNITPYPFLGMSAAGALSPGDKYFVFDQRNNGFFMGEGAGLILIKPLEKAEKDNDNILAVIKSSAINNDAKTISPMAPNPVNQRLVIEKAYEKSEIAKKSVDYIEAHGTGTILGDSTEFHNIKQVFIDRENDLYIGSVKPNIGHLLSGSGIASIIKCILMIQNKQIPPLINFEKPRENFDITNICFDNKLIDFKEKKLTIGINSFGFGGTNAHIILQSYGNKNKYKFKPFIPKYNKKEYWLTNKCFKNQNNLTINENKENIAKIQIPIWLEKNINYLKKESKKLTIITSSINEDFINLLENYLEIEEINYQTIYEFYEIDSIRNLETVLLIFPSSYTKLFEQVKKIKEKSYKEIYVISKKTKTEDYQKIVSEGLAFSLITEIGINYISIDNNNDFETTKIIINEILKNNNDKYVSYKNNQRLVKDFIDKSVENSNIKQIIKQNGVYLFTGGISGINNCLIKEITKENNVNIIVIGRRNKSQIPEWLEFEKEIFNKYSNIGYYSVDVSSSEEVDSLFQKIDQKFSRLDGIIHGAGLAIPNLLQNKSIEEFKSVLDPKVKGIINLDNKIESYRFDLDFLVSFSSISSVFYNFSKGIPDYSTANFFLDKYSELQRKKGKPYYVINWGPWSELGMAANNKLLLDSLIKKEIQPISNEHGIKYFNYVLANSIPQAIVLNSNKSAEIKFNEIKKTNTNKEKEVIINNESLKKAEHIEVNNNYDDLEQKIINIIEEELKNTGINKKVNIDDNLLDIGIDSLGAMEITAKLEKILSMNLPFELLFEYQTVKDISGFILKKNFKLSNKKTLEKPETIIDILPVQKSFLSAHYIFETPNFSFFRFELENELNLEVLNNSLKLVVKKHPLLRANFVKQDLKFIQKIKNYNDIEVQINEIEIKKNIIEFENDLVNQNFDLEKGQLFKVIKAKDKNENNHLIIFVHHIIFDGVSMSIFLRDLVLNYELLINNRKIDTIEENVAHFFTPNIQVNKISLIWWKDKVNKLNKFNNTEKINILVNYVSKESNYQKYSLSTEENEKIKTIAKSENIPIQMIFLAIYFSTLKEWISEPDLFINCAVSGRKGQLGINNVIGCFAEMYPIENNFDDINLIELAKKLRKKWNEYKQYHDISSVEINKIFKEEKINNTPFAFSFVHFNKEWSKQIKSLKIKDTNIRGFNFNTKIALQIWEDLDGFKFTINYPKGILNKSELSSFAKSFLNTISKLKVEKELIDNEKKNYFIETLLSYKNSKNIAIEYQDKSLSYLELIKEVNLVSGFLFKKGIKNGNRIGVIGSQSINTSILILSVLKLGATWVPVDKNYPIYRMYDIFKNSVVDLVIDTENNKSKYQNDFQKISIYNYLEIINHKYEHLQFNNLKLNEIAYIIYTSGSTGKPKGVPIHYGALINYLKWCIETFEYNEKDNIIGTSSISFDASLRQILAPILCGGTSYPIKKDKLIDPKEIYQFLDEKKITIWSSVPSLFEKLICFIENSEKKELDRLRIIKLGGERLNNKLIQSWRNIYGTNSKFVNLYGPTEATINTTYYQIPDNFNKKSVPIGNLLPNLEGYIDYIDNEIGELCITGENLTQGYLEKENDEGRFFNKDNNRYYRTGDLVSLNEEDQFIYHGRKDRQVKVRGYRIELDEIENIINNHAMVKSSFVEIIKKENYKSIFAFVNPKFSFFEKKHLLEFLKKELPEYMIPKIEFVDDIPLKENGKTDSQKLIDFSLGKKMADKQDINSNDSKKIIESIWKKILNTKNINPEADFFELGGDSLLLMDMFLSLEKHFDNLPRIAIFYKKSNLGSLIQMIKEVDKKQIVPKSKNKNKFNLSASQKGFYLTSIYSKETDSIWKASYNIYGNLNLEVINQALKELYKRHQMLSVKLITNNPPYFEKIEDVPENIIEYIDLVQEYKFDNNIIKQIIEADNLPIAITDYPLMDLKLFKYKNNEFVLSIKAHHILADGLSIKIFIKDLLQIYNDLLNGKPNSLNDLKNQFSDYIDLIESEKQDQNNNEYWLKVFSKKYEHPKIKNIEKEGYISKTINISNYDVIKIEKSNRNKKISLFSYLLSVYYQSLSNNLNQKDLIIGVAHHGRDYNLKDINNIFGCFTNSIPIRINDPNSEKEIHNIFSESLNHKFNTTEIMKKINIPPNILLGSQFFLTYLDETNNSFENKSSIKIKESESIFINPNNKSAVFLTVKKLKNELSFHFVFNKNNYDQENVDRFINSFSKLIEKKSKGTTNNITKKINFSRKPLDPKNINSILISYLPSFQELKKSGISNLDFIKKLVFPKNENILIQTNINKFGKTGILSLPFFAEEINLSNKEKIISSIQKGIEYCVKHKIQNISLAGMLPAITSYGKIIGFDNKDIKLTTGHSTTVATVTKTIIRALEKFDIDINQKKVAFVGLGSIGSSVLRLLLELKYLPEEIVLCDIQSSKKNLENIANEIRSIYQGKIDFSFSEKGSLNQEIYNSDIIIGAVSATKILDINLLNSNTLVIDDSFPHFFDSNKAIERIKTKKDVIISGGGLLSIENLEANYYLPFENKFVENEIIKSILPNTIPSCHAESLFLSIDKSLPVTIGTVKLDNSLKYFNKLYKLKMNPAPLHINSFLIE